MARNQNRKDKQKALRNARKDGKISGKDAALLKDLGISNRQIKSTKGGSVKIGKNVQATIKPAKSTPAPSNIYKDAGKTATKGINQVTGKAPGLALAEAKKNGSISASEAQNLLGLGIQMNDLRKSAIPDGVRITNKAADYYKDNQTMGQYGTNSRNNPNSPANIAARAKAAKNNNNSSGGGDKWGGLLDKKQLRALQEDVGGGYNYYSDDPDPDQGYTPGKTSKDIDYSAYNRGDWKKVAKSMNINNVDTPGDVSRLFAYVNNYESNFNNNGGGNNNNSNNNNSTSGADRDSGKFGDIRDAINEDIAINNGRADDLDNRGVDTSNPNQNIIDELEQDIINNQGGGNQGGGNKGGNNGGNEVATIPNAYQDIIDGLTASNAELQGYTQQVIDDNAVQKSGFEAALAQQALDSTNALNGLNDLFMTSFNGIQGQIQSQQQEFNTAQSFMQQQLANANNLYLAEQQRSANLGNAYVPNANPNALSIGYGDNRNRKRQGQDNLLSDLTLMSGLGTQQNPLAGLQLA